MLKKFLFNTFKQDFLKFAYKEQDFKHKPDAKLTFQFIDSEGNKYFSYSDELQFPLNRKGMIDLFYKELNASLNQNNLWKFMDTIDELALEEIENPKKRGGNTAKIRHLIDELRLRKDSLVREDILWKLFAAYYIREDENPFLWDEEFQAKKIEQLKKDVQEGSGLYDFFYKKPLKVHLPYANIPPEQLLSILTESMETATMHQQLANTYSTGEK